VATKGRKSMSTKESVTGSDDWTIKIEHGYYWKESGVFVLKIENPDFQASPTSLSLMLPVDLLKTVIEDREIILKKIKKIEEGKKREKRLEKNDS